MAQKRQKAETWARAYSASPMASISGPADNPAASAVSLPPSIVSVCYEVGRIYNDSWSLSDATSLALSIESMPIELTPSVINTIAQLAIKHFEDAAEGQS